jgi:dipeptidyl aminopeptidase/acylaminoacyl peptidase
VGADGRVVVRDVDSGALLWRSASRADGARELSWSADGRLLLVRAAGGLLLADVGTAGRMARVRLPGGGRPAAAAWAPRGRRLAVVARASRGLTRVLVAPASRRLPDRPVFATTGRLASPAWSPDGRRVLVRWVEADQWLLLRAPSAADSGGGAARVVAIGAVARRFGGVPVVRGWCCRAR